MATYREEEDPFEEDIVFDQAGLLNSTSKMNTAIRRVSSGKCVLFAKTLGLCGAFFGLGLCIAIPGPTFLSPLTDLENSISPVSHIYVARTSGYVIGSIIGGVLFDRFNRLFLLFLSLLLTAVFITVTPWCQAVWLLEACMVILGITMGFLDTGGNVLCLDLWGRNSGPFMQALHFSFGLGAFVAPLLAAPFLEPTFANLSLSTEMTHTITELPVHLPSVTPQLYDSNRMKRENEALYTSSHLNDTEDDSQQMSENDSLFPDMLGEMSAVPTSYNPMETVKSNGTHDTHPDVQVDANATVSASITTAKPKHKPSKTDGTKLGNTDWDKVPVRKPPAADLLPLSTSTTTPSLTTSTTSTTASTSVVSTATAATNTSANITTSSTSTKEAATAATIASSKAVTTVASSPVVTIPWTSHVSSNVSSSHLAPVTIPTTSSYSFDNKGISASSSTTASILTSVAKANTAATTPRTTTTLSIPHILENSTDNYVPNFRSMLHVSAVLDSAVSTNPLEPESVTQGFESTATWADKPLRSRPGTVDSPGTQQEIADMNNEKSMVQNSQSKNYSGFVGVPSVSTTEASILSTESKEQKPKLESDLGNEESIIAEGLNMKHVKSDQKIPMMSKENLSLNGNTTTAGVSSQSNLPVSQVAPVPEDASHSEPLLRKASGSVSSDTANAYRSFAHKERGENSDLQDTSGRSEFEHGGVEATSLRTRTSTITDAASADPTSPVVYATSPVPKHTRHKPGSYDNDTEHINTIFDIFANRIEKYGFSKIQFSYLIVGIFVFSISLVFLGFLCHNPRDPKSKQEEGQGAKKITNKIVHRLLVSLMALFYFLYMGLEVTYGQLVLAFSMNSSLQLAQSTGSVISVVFWGSFTAMRFASIFFAIGFSPVTMLILNFVFCTTGTILIFSALAAHVETALWVGTALIGVSLASMFPTGILWIERYIHVSNKVAAVFVIGVSLGKTICPVTIYRLMVIEPLFFIHSALVINIMCILIFAVLWWLASRQGEKYSVINNNGYQLASQHDEEEDMMDMSPSGSGVVLRRHSFSSEHRALLNGNVHRGP